MWGIIGGLTAVVLEVSYRKGWLAWDVPLLLLIALPLALLVDFAVWKNMTTGPTFLQAIVLFSATVAIGRIAASVFIVHDPLTWQNVIAGVALLFAAGIKFV